MIQSVFVHCVFLAIEYDVCVLPNTNLDPIFTQGRVCWTRRGSGRTARRHHEPKRQVVGKVHLICDSLEEAGDARFGVTVEICAHAAEIDFRLLTSYFDNDFVACFIDEGPHVVDPAPQRRLVGG